jgi:hypothetical protein
MSNAAKFCSCKACKAGRHSKGSKARTRAAMRSARHAAKQTTKHGTEPPPAKSIPYSD